MKINGKTILSTSSTTTNYVLKQSSTAGTLINSQIFDNGTNVGIGTTSPSSLLHLSKNGEATLRISNTATPTETYIGSDGIGSYLAGSSNVVFYSGGFNERMRITSGGNVGIGTSSASEKLQVNGSVLSTSTLNSTSGSFLIDHPGVNSWKIGITNSNTSTFSIGNDSGGSFANKILNITNSGNVGIGTTSPIHQLSVANKIGGILFGDSFLEFPSSGNTIVKANNDVIIGYSQNTVITQNGSVGIGTTTPDASALLDVSSTTQGFLPPRMTTSERDAISSPASGLMIWNTDNRQIEVFSVSVWVGL